MVEVQCIVLKVIGVGQNLNEIHFRVKCNIRLSRMMEMYSNRVGVPLHYLRFLYDGVRVNNDDTPAMLDMDDGAVIEVLPEMVGGAEE